MHDIEKIIEERLARLRRQYKLDADSTTRHRIEELTLLRTKLRKSGVIAGPQPKHQAVSKINRGGVSGLD